MKVEISSFHDDENDDDCLMEHYIMHLVEIH